jgi:hypothetical protein
MSDCKHLMIMYDNMAKEYQCAVCGEPIRQLPPVPSFPTGPMSDECFNCHGHHGNLPCPQLAPQSDAGADPSA